MLYNNYLSQKSKSFQPMELTIFRLLSRKGGGFLVEYIKERTR